MEMVTVKLLVDRSRDRVLFAESERDFVDILLSFLTLPLGTIVRLAGKRSDIGCLDRLYQCVEGLDLQYFTSDECRTMLLRPSNLAGDKCRRLKVNIDDTKAIRYYMCDAGGCNLLRTKYEVRCLCQALTYAGAVNLVNPDSGYGVDGGDDGGRGVFTKGWMRFTISDDMEMAPVTDTCSLLAELGARDESTLEEREVHVGHSEVLDLLRCSLLSKMSLTNAFLPTPENISMISSVSLKPMHSSHQPKIEEGMATHKINVKLLVSKHLKKVLYAEANQDFVELLFSFLTFPAGSVVRLLCGKPLGCFSNLYGSAENLNSKGCLIGECEEMLLNPKLPCRFKCQSQQLRIEEVQQYYMGSLENIKCPSPFCLSVTPGITCMHKTKLERPVNLVDPKNPIAHRTGGGFLKSGVMYVVTDELEVMKLSIISSISLRKKAGTSVKEMEEMFIEIGEKEALTLLAACLTSKTPLTDAFMNVAGGIAD